MICLQIVLIYSTLLLLLHFAASQKVCSPEEIRLRKEIRDMSSEEMRAYLNAVQMLHKKEPGKSSKYDELVKIHMDGGNLMLIHGVEHFLPWHRKYLYDFETEIRRYAPNIAVPYWDWTLDSQQPEKSIVFQVDYFGASGDSKADYCLKTGPFAGWQMQYPTPHCLRRKWQHDAELPAQLAPEILENIIKSTKSFSKFSTTIENAHGPIHVFIGGFDAKKNTPIGDMADMHSPNDPLFYLHHSFVDYQWHTWQSIANNFQEPKGGKLYYFNTGPETYLSLDNLCVKYQLGSRKEGFTKVLESFSGAAKPTSSTASSPISKPSSSKPAAKPKPPKGSSKTPSLVQRGFPVQLSPSFLHDNSNGDSPSVQFILVGDDEASGNLSSPALNVDMLNRLEKSLVHHPRPNNLNVTIAINSSHGHSHNPKEHNNNIHHIPQRKYELPTDPRSIDEEYSKLLKRLSKNEIDGLLPDPYSRHNRRLSRISRFPDYWARINQLDPAVTKGVFDEIDKRTAILNDKLLNDSFISIASPAVADEFNRKFNNTSPTKPNTQPPPPPPPPPPKKVDQMKLIIEVLDDLKTLLQSSEAKAIKHDALLFLFPFILTILLI